MPDPRVVDELEGNLRALQERRDDLMQDLPAIEEVTQANTAVTELRAMLEATSGDAEAVNEKLGEYVEKLGDLGGEIRKAIQDPAVAQLTEGIGSGLEGFQGALEAVNDTLEPLDQAIKILQDALETSERPADEQIQALADTFATVVEKLEPLTKQIPGLGAFFEIYAKAIQAIAISVGQLQATQRSLQKAWGQLRPGTTMYIQPRNAHEIHQAEIRAVELEIDRTVQRLVEIAEEERAAIPDDQMTEVDIAVRAAERDCQQLLPGGYPPELRARDEAWRDLQAADDARGGAQADYDAACEEADRAAIRLETATSSDSRGGASDVEAARANAAATASARARALETLRAREADQDARQSAYDTAQAAWQTLRQPYEDCIKSRLQQLGQYANQGQGFTDNDRRYLQTTYPEYAAPAATPSTPAPVAPARPPVEVSSATGGRSFPRRLVFGGGGILAAALVGVVIVFGGGDGDGNGGAPAAGAGAGAGGGSSVALFAAPDPTGDLEATFDDFDPIESPNVAADVTEMRAELDGDGDHTRITLRFAGDARSLSDIQGEALEADILITPPDGGRIYNILLRDDGSSKISDPGSGMSVSSGWIAGDTLVFDVSGYVPPAGSTIALRTIQEYRGTFSSDDVALLTDEGGENFVGTSDGFEGAGAPGTASEQPPAVSAEACEAVRERQLILDFSSADVQPTIPAFYGEDARDDNDFPAPGFDWSAVPPETTQIAILVMSLNDERAASYRADPNLWWDGRESTGTVTGIPIGSTRWTLTGIDATVTSLAASSRSNPPPAGMTEQALSGTGTQRDGVDLSHKFIGPGVGSGPYLFTVFALCDPVEGEQDEYTAGWLKRYSIATGWFFADPEE